MIVFVHLERTGGTKIQETIAGCVPGRHILLHAPAQVPGSLKYARSQVGRCWFVGGHLRFSELWPFLEQRQPADVLFSTTRDPLERAVSLYYFTLRSPLSQPSLVAFAQRSFADFYSAAVDHDVLAPNAQCRFLANTVDWNEARAVVLHHYNVVGVHSHYNQFLGQLKELLRDKGVGLEFDGSRQNAAYHQKTSAGEWRRKTDIGSVVDAPTRRRMERDNTSDQALVEFIESQPNGVLEGR